MKELEVSGPVGPQLLACGPSGLLDIVLRALRALRPCDPRRCVHDACLHETCIHDACFHEACIHDAWRYDAWMHDEFFLLPTNEPTVKARYMYDVCMMQERVMLVSRFA